MTTTMNVIAVGGKRQDLRSWLLSGLAIAHARVALIAHDNGKGELLDWARFNRGTLSAHDLYATGTTGTPLARKLGLTDVLPE
jgi:hypothetical protein